MKSKAAIIGMEAIFGPDEGLGLFDRIVFDGIHQATQQSRGQGKRLRHGGRSQVKEEYLRLLKGKAPLSTPLLLRLVLGGALQDTEGNATPDVNMKDTGVIILSDSSQPEINVRYSFCEPTVAQGMDKALELLSEGKVRQVLVGAACMDVQENETGPSDGNTKGDPDTLQTGQGACAILLALPDQARQEGSRIYALLDGFARSQGDSEKTSSVENETVVCRAAMEIAEVAPSDLGHLEIMGGDGKIDDLSGMEGLVKAYETGNGDLSCALGTASSNIGDVSLASDLAGIVRAALSIHHRYIPSVPLWSGPVESELWQQSPFYVPTESRPWFVRDACPVRKAAVHGRGAGGSAHLILSEETRQKVCSSNRYLSLVSPYCFPLAGSGPEDLIRQIESLQQAIEKKADLGRMAKANLALFEKKRFESDHALMLLGHDSDELLKEIQFLTTGIPRAFAEGREAKTPKGSYVTPDPLGKDGGVAFVYPGVGSSYVGLGQGLFHLFPQIYEPFSEVIPDMGGLLKERELYPRSLKPLTEDETWKLELKMRKDILTIGESGMGFFWLYTLILRECFKVNPQYALGYSMGEPGMMSALGVWSQPGQLVERFARSPIFSERLDGRLNAVREYWGMEGAAEDSKEKIWESYTLMAPTATVEEAAADEPRVFITIINAPEEVVIGGDPLSCRRVIEKLGCKYYPLGLNLVIHSAPAKSEYNCIAELYSLPILNKNPEIRFYSSSCYRPIPIRRKSVSQSIAKAFTGRVDFPQLINRAYDDGARLFIEMGSRKFCTNLIDKILKGKAYLANSINIKGTKDQISVARLLAQLVSHQVPVNLSPLF